MEKKKQLDKIKKEIKNGVEAKYNQISEMTNSEIIFDSNGAVLNRGGEIVKLTI